jgi:hypothetical protein
MADLYDIALTVGQPMWQSLPRQGWECPCCGRCYSPSMPQCVACPIQTVTTTDSTQPKHPDAVGTDSSAGTVIDRVIFSSGASDTFHTLRGG